MPLGAVVALAPFALEAVDLLSSWIAVIGQDEEPTAEELEALKARFVASQQRRDAAIAALDDAIAAKRAEQSEQEK